MPKKLFLYSLGLTDDQFSAFEALVQKTASEISMLMIENATDIIPDSAGWVEGIRNQWKSRGYQVETLDLRNFLNENAGKQSDAFSKADVLWFCGGHTYYLRWIVAASQSESLIRQHIDAGKVYAGWSAGAVIAGPSIAHFGHMGDDPLDAPEQIYSGLKLVGFCIVPHMDNPGFQSGASKTNELLESDGYITLPMNDNEVLIIDGDKQHIIVSDR